MRKVVLLVFTICLMTLMSSASFAAVQSFKDFFVDVPSGWQAWENGNVVALVAPGQTAPMSIAMDSAQDMSAEDLATAFAEQLKGTAPEATNDGGYEFTFKNASGVDSQSTLYVEDNQYILITLTGDHPDFLKIIDSLEEN